MDEIHELDDDEDIAGRPISEQPYVALGPALTTRSVSLALAAQDSLPPVKLAGLAVHWTRDAMTAFGSLRDEARRLDPVVGQTLPFTGLRVLLEMGIDSISRIDQKVGLFSPLIPSKHPIMFVDEPDQRALAAGATRIVSEWLDNYLVPTFERVGLDPASAALQKLREMIAAGQMFRFETYEERLFPWSWSEQTGTTKVQGNPFRALADHLARTLEGAVVFDGLGPLRRMISRYQADLNAGTVELITAPIEIVEEGPFSLVVHLNVRTLPGMHQPLVTVDVSKRRWATRLKERLRTRNAINGVVMSNLHPTRVFGFSCSRHSDGSIAIWKPDVEFQALQRRMALPLVSMDAHRIARGEASTPQAKVLLIYQPRLQDKDHPVLLGVPERDKLEAFDRVAEILTPLGLHPVDHFKRVRAPKRGADGSTAKVRAPKRGADGSTAKVRAPKRGADGSTAKVRAPKRGADGSTANIDAPSLLRAAILASETNPLALTGDGGSVEATVEMLRGHLTETLRRRGRQTEKGSGSLAELLKANASAMQQLYPEGRPLLVVFHEAGASAPINLLKAAIRMLWGDAVELITNHIPPDAHGPMAVLPGANEKARERAQRRDEAWRHVAAQIAARGRRTFCIVMAAEWYRAAGGAPKHDDPVNKPAARRALAKHGRACVQYLCPPQPTKSGALNASDFLQRVQSALRDLVLAHSGRVADQAGAVRQHFQSVPEASRPREVIGLTIIRRNAKRPLGWRDSTFLAVALRLDVPTGRVDMCCAHEGAGNPTVTAWERLPDALATVAGLSPARLADKMDLAKQRFMRFANQVISEAVDRDANPVVIVDSTNCVHLWSWLADQKLNAREIGIVDRERMHLEWAGARIVRVRQDHAPGLIEDKVKRLGLSSNADSRAVANIPCDLELAAPSSAKGLYRVAVGPVSATYWSVVNKTLHQNARGPSCYKPTRWATPKWIDDEKVRNGGGEPLLSLSERPAWTNQWPTPNALEIVVSLKQDDDDCDDIALFVQSLRYGLGHYKEGVTLPVPLFFERVVDDYISEFKLDDGAGDDDEAEHG